MATGRLALFAGLVAAVLSALLARTARTTEDEMLLRAGLAFVLFALLTKAVAAAVVYLVPELSGQGQPRKTARAAPAEAPEAGPSPPGAPVPRGPEPDRGAKGSRLDVVLPGTTAEEVLNAETGKEVAG